MDEIKVKDIQYTTAIIEYRGKEHKLNIKHSSSHGYYVEFLNKRIQIHIKKAEN
jgi:hypothetical protein